MPLNFNAKTLTPVTVSPSLCVSLRLGVYICMCLCLSLWSLSLMVDTVANPLSMAGPAVMEPSTQPCSGKPGLRSCFWDLLATSVFTINWMHGKYLKTERISLFFFFPLLMWFFGHHFLKCLYLCLDKSSAFCLVGISILWLHYRADWSLLDFGMPYV